MSDYKTGAELLADFNCRTREQKLEHAVKAMLIELNMLHVEFHNQDLEDGLTDQSLFLLTC